MDLEELEAGGRPGFRPSAAASPGQREKQAIKTVKTKKKYLLCVDIGIAS